jgi:hypothetical protein
MTDPEGYEFELDEIFRDEDRKVCEDSLELYLSFLQCTFMVPFELTGSEEFDWEEDYIFGSGNQNEYKKLKMKQHHIKTYLHSCHLLTR